MSPGLRTLLFTKSFDPLQLFRAGEQGLWYDPSDLNSMFQDAGITPAVVGQPVGLRLDKRLGLGRGAERKSSGITLLVGAATAATYNTTTGEGSVSRVDLANQSYVAIPGFTANSFCEVGIAVTGANQVNLRSGSASGTVTAALAGGTIATPIVPVGSDGTLYITAATGGTTATFTVSSARSLPGNHATSSGTARPILRQDSSGYYYLEFDGLDDYYVTQSINFTATNKMTVISGLRKTSDAAAAVFAELSTNYNNNSGSFLIAAPDSVAATYSYSQQSGSAYSIVVVSGATAPHQAVLAFGADLSLSSNEVSVVRMNGTVPSFSRTANQDLSGNFGNFAFYMGARAGSSSFFTGRDYGIIVRGASTNSTRIAQAERWVGRKMGTVV